MKHLVLSPAKVNLFLKVLSKRPDGYHNIVSIVDIVSLCDAIHIEEISDNTISLTDSRRALPDGPGNTIYRAIAALKDRYGIKTGVRVHVEKNIPIGSGLGGPSSNAATALKAMARIWNLPVTEEELHEIGRTVGADVPLFLYGKPCVMKGIGDLISPVQLPILWYLIVYPAMQIQTKVVYEGLKIVLTKKENDIKLLGKFDTAREICAILENDLEKVGTVICPAIQVIKDRLIEAGSIGALMSGSGSSVFGIFESETKAREASALLAGMGDVFVVRSVVEEGYYGTYGHREVSCT
ncbi:MAG: 4-diphosphocytidyl-2-C-methyl-D-erythritol kinase [Syntrophorhabdus sp. PtaU1.Bin153]|nr:MAG: 4-diphosphocytidyl-2-C-methyl-D-erythritol kinase [Syntrophorhabdus sp. PtaU1.Bin153]